MFLDRIWRWLDDRLGLEPLLRTISARGLNPVYSLGGLSFLFFLIQAVTGVVLALYYSPTPETAYDSVQKISTALRYGWMIRGVHFYAANCMIIAAILHMGRSYFRGAYKKPQELNWVVGVLIGAVAIMSGFTGYVLRWDQEAVGASGIGKGLAVSIPQIGIVLMKFLWGQSDADMAHRFFTIHTLLLPGLIASLLAVHYFMVRKQGVEVLLGELNLAPIVIGSLLVFVSVFPVRLGPKFDPMNPPTVLEPEWFFMGLYQFIKTQSIQPIHGVVLIVAFGLFLVAIPFVDRGSERSALRRPLFTALALFMIVEFLGLTVYGYLSPGQMGTFSDSRFAEAFILTNLVALGVIVLVFAGSRRALRNVRNTTGRTGRFSFRSGRVSEGRVALAVGLVFLESFLVFEAILAHVGGSERIFGILAGLGFLCFAALLYVASVLFFTQNDKHP
jgi:ubiquinol-cytochrome c reductase cytochrome b subunit